MYDFEQLDFENEVFSSISLLTNECFQSVLLGVPRLRHFFVSPFHVNIFRMNVSREKVALKSIAYVFEVVYQVKYGLSFTFLVWKHFRIFSPLFQNVILAEFCQNDGCRII